MQGNFGAPAGTAQKRLDAGRFPTQHGVVKAARIPELDGLRGVAILLVVIYHYTNGSMMVAANGPAYYVARIFQSGSSGVDLFFVLSGFLIGGILMGARGSSSYFRTFYLRRFFRIIPIYYLWIAGYLALVALVGRFIELHSFSGRTLPRGMPVYAHFLFLQNFLPRSAAVDAGLWGSWFSHLWSLAVEEQFYLLAPLLIAWLEPRRLPAALWGIVIGAAAFRSALYFHPWPIDVTQTMPARADELALGMLAAIAWRTPGLREGIRARAGMLGAAMLVMFLGYCVLLQSAAAWKVASFCFGPSIYGVFYTLLLLAALAKPEGWIAAGLRARWLRETGRVSYCMYIIHLAAGLALYYLLLHERPEIASAAGALTAVLAVGATYGLARLSWALVEAPLVGLGHKFAFAPPGAPADAREQC